jgi:hypothetical protein
MATFPQNPSASTHRFGTVTLADVATHHLLALVPGLLHDVTFLLARLRRGGGQTGT